MPTAAEKATAMSTATNTVVATDEVICAAGILTC
jgi:hypothetical protein